MKIHMYSPRKYLLWYSLEMRCGGTFDDYPQHTFSSYLELRLDTKHGDCINHKERSLTKMHLPITGRYSQMKIFSKKIYVVVLLRNALWWHF